MNLVPIKPALPVVTLLAPCLKCGGPIRSDTGFADLHGEPYKAYYCAPCAGLVNRPQLPPQLPPKVAP